MNMVVWRYRNAGFILPLSLSILLILLVISLLVNKGVVYDIWSTVAQKRAATFFYAAESAAKLALVNFIYTDVADSLSAGESKLQTLNIFTGEGNVPVEVTVRFLGISRNCDFQSVCCRRFEIKSQVQNSEVVVRFLALKAIPNPEQDEQAKKVCVM